MKPIACNRNTAQKNKTTDKKGELLIKQGHELLERARPQVIRETRDARLLIKLRAEINQVLNDSEAPLLKDEKAHWISPFASKSDLKEMNESKNLYAALVDCRLYIEGLVRVIELEKSQ